VPKYPLTGGELDGARLDAQMSFPRQIARSLDGVARRARHEVERQGGLPPAGQRRERSFASLYFDRESGLLVRTIRYTPSKMAKCRRRWTTADYRDISGSSFPTVDRSRGWTAATSSTSPT
jgi:hypothetical protein